MIYGSNNYTTSGRRKKKSTTKRTRRTFTELRSNTPEPYRRDTVEYRSASCTTGTTARVDPMYYTGTLIKGIGTMHKSNAIPVINEQEMKDLARMRR